MSVNKTIPLPEGVVFKLPGEFLNAFNHTRWRWTPIVNGVGSTAAQSTMFGTTNTTLNGPRNIEIRANFEF